MRRLFVASALLLGLGLGSVQAADRVQVSYANVDMFADFGDGRWERERNQVSFAEMLQLLAERLPPGQELKVRVVDVNLAGELDWLRGRTDRIRVLRDVSWPIVEFEYELVEGGKTLKAEKVRLSDMAYLQSSIWQAGHSGESFTYERRMLERWARQSFAK